MGKYLKSVMIFLLLLKYYLHSRGSDESKISYNIYVGSWFADLNVKLARMNGFYLETIFVSGMHDDLRYADSDMRLGKKKRYPKKKRQH